MRTITLTLPYPISANRYWKQFVLGKGASARMMQAPSAEAKEYKRQVAKAAVLGCVGQPITGRVRVEVRLYPQRPQDWARRAQRNPLSWDDDVRCLDLDNANKVLFDALKGVAIEDDRWVREIDAKRMEPDGEARVVVTVTALHVEQPQASLLETTA